MRSVADDLSRELRETAARLTPQERIDLMLSPGGAARIGSAALESSAAPVVTDVKQIVAGSNPCT